MSSSAALCVIAKGSQSSCIALTHILAPDHYELTHSDGSSMISFAIKEASPLSLCTDKQSKLICGIPLIRETDKANSCQSMNILEISEKLRLSIQILNIPLARISPSYVRVINGSCKKHSIFVSPWDEIELADTPNVEWLPGCAPKYRPLYEFESIACGDFLDILYDNNLKKRVHEVCILRNPLEASRLKELSNEGGYHDHFYFTTDADRLYPLFGMEKLAQQNLLRGVHSSESRARMSDAIHKYADLTATPEKEGDWAIMGGLAQGIGGLGAGIAAATQTQINNAGVRQRNAERAAQAKTLHSMAENLSCFFGNPNDKFALSADDIKELGFRVTTSTDTLFSKLSFSMSAFEPRKLTEDTRLRKNDYDTAHQLFSVKISSNHHRRIDGYVLINLKNKRGKTLHEKIIPLPLLGVGSAEDTSCIGLHLPGGLRYASFKPLVLWEITDKSSDTTIAAASLTDFPTDSRLYADWQQNLNAHRDSLLRLNGKKRSKVFVWIAAAVAVIIAVLMKLH